MRYPRSILIVALLCLAGPAAAALSPTPAPWDEPAEEQARHSEAYRAGKRALGAEQWSEAVDRFGEAASRDEGDGDGALYWKAYALLRLNRGARAQLAVEELRRRFPESNWIDDAQALEIEIQRTNRQPTNPDAVADEELKLIALNGLMHLDWNRARPILQSFLAGRSSPRLMERALFILSQNDSPEARQMLLGIARDATNPELSEEAIQYLAFFDDDEARAELRKLYRELTDFELKERVLESMMIADDLESLLAVASTETNLELRKSAIQQLGLLDAKGELRQLYATESSRSAKEEILRALMLADDLESLLAVARTEPAPELRAEAIQQIGLLDGVAELRELYRGESSADVRSDIAEALMLADDAEFLLEIANNDKDPEVREQAIEGLGLLDSPESSAGLSRLYETSTDVETKKQIIESFMLKGDAPKLIGIVKTEKNTELRKEALETLSIMNSEEATAFLLEILQGGG